MRDYDTTLRTFPTVLWAKTFYSSAKPMVMFVASDSAQAAPTVSFNLGAGTPPASAAPAQ